MKLTSFVYCQDTKNDQGNTIIVAPFQMLTPINLPTNYSFTFSFGLLGKPAEFVDKKVIAKFKNPNNVEISKSIFEIPTIPDEFVEKSNYIGIQINLGWMNVVLDVEGVYNTVVEIDGEELKVCPIDVYVSK